jgi:hypothetical protein
MLVAAVAPSELTLVVAVAPAELTLVAIPAPAPNVQSNPVRAPQDTVAATMPNKLAMSTTRWLSGNSPENPG